MIARVRREAYEHWDLRLIGFTMWAGALAAELILAVDVRSGGAFAGWLGGVAAFLPPCVAGLVMWWIEGHRVERYLWREFEGVCRSCGYELNGNTSGVCPECGTPIPATS